MINLSKVRDPRFWVKWHASGAVKKMSHAKSLRIDSMCTHHGGPYKGHMVLSLGSQVISSGPGWAVSKTLYSVVVPTSSAFQLGMVLLEIPNNAVPAEVFFGKNQ